jgi:hypothetical protein
MEKIIQNFKKNKWFCLALLGILFLGGFLRLYNLGENPFVADEFLDVNATYGYHQLGEWQAWDFNHQEASVRDNQLSDQRAWIYRWQVAQLYNFLPPTEFTIRLISALWGILTILILYLITFSLTKNRWIALITAFLWAVSVPAIEINRKIRMYSMFAPMFLIFSWAVFKFIETGKLKTKSWLGEIFNLNYIYLIPVVIFGNLSLHLHQMTGTIALVIFVYCLIRWVMVWRQEGKWLNRYGFYLDAIIILTFLFWLMAREQFAWFLNTLTFFENHWNYLNHLSVNYANSLVGWTLMLVGGWYLWRQKKNSQASVWIVVNFWVILLAAIFLWRRNVGVQYIFFIQTFGFILAGSGIFWLAKFLATALKNTSLIFRKRKIQLTSERWMLIIISLALIFVPNYSYFFQENNTYHLKSSADTPNYRKVFDYVKRHSNSNEVMITRNFRNYYFNDLNLPVFDFGSDRSGEVLAQEGKVKKITLAYLQGIRENNPSGWVVFSDNDKIFIEKEAREYIDENFQKIEDSPLIRGRVSVYHWE